MRPTRTISVFLLVASTPLFVVCSQSPDADTTPSPTRQVTEPAETSADIDPMVAACVSVQVAAAARRRANQARRDAVGAAR